MNRENPENMGGEGQSSEGRSSPGKTLARPGDNCWRVEPFSRAAFLVDADAYFDAFVECCERAKKSILIVGWDLDSRVPLRRKKRTFDKYRLGEFLNGLVETEAELEIHILIWDYALFYAMEREPLLTYKLDKKSHPRIHFHYDSEHPAGGSHHQKVVVVDDKVAFSGGIDLTTHRWDTPRHDPDEPLRETTRGETYGPYHDVMMMVEGDAAKALGDLARERWKRATGLELKAPPEVGTSPWTPKIEPHMRDGEVVIARTFRPTGKEEDPILEAEKLFLDTIAAAKEYIYIENQFLTSARICEALSESLKKEDGPEIIIVTPRHGPGWIESKTMGALRERVVKRLRDSDGFDRLRIFYPTIPGWEENGVFIHSKIFIADDEILRVGSANLSNRSLGLDSECDLAVEAAGDEERKSEIRAFRDRLISEHLGVSAQAVSQAQEEERSFILGVERLSEGDRCLKPLEEELPDWAVEMVPDNAFFDPEESLFPHVPIEEAVKLDDDKKSLLGRAGFVLLAVIVVGGLAAAWRYTPLSEYANPERLAALAGPVVESRWSVLLVALAFVVGGFVMFPVTVLVLATALLFPPVEAFIYAMTGCLANAAALYGAGSVMGKGRVRSLAGERLNRVSERIADRGIMAVALVRNVPVAPFTVVNLVAGVSHVSFRDFMIGTLLGMAPGVLAITFFGESLGRMVRDPSAANLLVLLAAAALVALVAFFARRFFIKRKEKLK